MTIQFQSPPKTLNAIGKPIRWVVRSWRGVVPKLSYPSSILNCTIIGNPRDGRGDL
jgi:hypothetical protein